MIRRIVPGFAIALLILLMWRANAFTQLRLALNDVYFVDQANSGEIVIVAVDDASLSQYGRTPAEWSRAVYADFLNQIITVQPRVIAFDLIFSEATPEDEAFLQALQAVRQSDARTRIVMAGVGVADGGQTDEIVFPNALQPNSTLLEAVDYIGFANVIPDADGRVRRQLSTMQVMGDRQVSFNLAVYLAYLRIPAAALEQVITRQGDDLTIAQRSIKVDDFGLWRQNYFSSPVSVSFQDVIAGNFDPAQFADKIVLVGLQDSIGATDRYLVPSFTGNILMSGVEIQAHAVETLLQNLALQEQSDLTQVIVILVFAIISTFLYSFLKWYYKLVLWAGLLAVWVVAAFVIFGTQQLIINLFHSTLAFSLPVVLAIGLDINREIQERLRSEFLLQSILEVSRQQLVLQDMLGLVAGDIQRILPGSAGFVRLGEYQQDFGISSDAKPLTIPIVWQKQQLGLLSVQHSARIAAKSMNLLEELVDQIAPTIENAVLHHRIQRQNQLLGSVFDNSPASIIVIDDNFVIERCNDVLAEIVKQPYAALTGQSLLKLLPEQDDTLQKNIAKGVSFHQQIQIEDRFFNLEAAPLYERTQWVIVLNDVTDLINLTQLKTQMIRMASHDLKNPLGRVNGYAELILMDGTLNEETQRFMGYITDASNEMLEIISGILDLEQLRSGEIIHELLDFQDMVQDIIRRYEPDIERKTHQLRVDIPAKPRYIHGNYQRLSQAVSNLVSNAIKYMPDKGQITITLADEPGYLRLEVRDTGLGIAKDAQAKLFTEFYRVRTRATASIPGTGLGLSLVKSVVEAHKGEIWFESEENVGSVFFIRLPLPEKDAQA